MQNRLSLKQLKNTGNHCNHSILILASEPNHNHAGIRRRRVFSYIGKIQIECYEDAMFFLADLGDGWISGTAQMFIVDRVRVVTACAKQLSGFDR